MWSLTKLNFLFYDLLWFFKDLAEIIKKEKDKTTVAIAKPLFTVAKPFSKLLRMVKCTVWKIEGDDLSDFVVEGGKIDFYKN